MIRRHSARVGAVLVTAAAFVFLPSPGLAQHGGGHGGGGGHAGGGHAGGGHGGYHGGGYSGGGYRGGAYHGGYDHGYYHDHHHPYYFGAYPYWYGGFWSGYDLGYYDYPDVYLYAAPRVYSYAPLVGSEPYVSVPAAASAYAGTEEWDHADQRVAARVILPTPDATLWVEGQEASSTGTSRSFVSPPLEPGRYTYTFRARWTQDGKTMVETRTARVQPGDRITVDFTSPEKN